MVSMLCRNRPERLNGGDFFRTAQIDELSSACHKFLDLSFLIARNGLRLGPVCLSETGQNECVDLVRFCKLSDASGKVPHLPRIDDGKR